MVRTASANGGSTARDVPAGHTPTRIQFGGQIEAEDNLKQRYGARARWTFHRDAMKQISKLKDGEGRYIWRASVREGEPDRILNHPMDISEFAPNTFTTGSAFGIFPDHHTPLIFVSIIGIGILIMIYRSQRMPTGLLRLSLGLQIGGATGNLLDRLRLGHVTDFVDVGAWPVFNMADASIITGLVILAYIFLVAESDDKKDSGPISGYSWCPVCEGEMRTVTDGWRCSTCGVKERLLEERPMEIQTIDPAL